ncbi:hypothetical protein [Mesorhizobium sp. Z1-4]|uniref:hypothetical protein n=1 Tax=Mesorhizobium sp. Z1-4 TaxID=2448478 RepID=UPI000FD6E295|nr:hypothetical protein [Mesorhizobium sp. Z1-4]
MTRHPCDIHKIADKCGVRLLDSNGPHRFDPRRPKVCFAKGTLRRIGQANGEGHLALVLRLIVETEGNAGELYRDTLQAVSALLLAHPGIVDRGTALFDQFDAIDLADMRRKAKALAKGLRVSQVMYILIALELHQDRPIEAEKAA